MGGFNHMVPEKEPTISSIVDDISNAAPTDGDMEEGAVTDAMGGTVKLGEENEIEIIYGNAIELPKNLILPKE